jgi:hypothetical protein
MKARPTSPLITLVGAPSALGFPPPLDCNLLSDPRVIMYLFTVLFDVCVI